MELLAKFFRQELFSHMGESIVLASLILIRVLGFLHMAPVFSHKSISSLSRIGLSILFTMFLLDIHSVQKTPSEGYYLPYVAVLNLAIGLLMGFTGRVMFSIVSAAGEMMDAAMGLSSAQTFDPTMGAQTTIMGKFMAILSIVVFFAVSGPEMLLQGLSNSIDSFPLYSPIVSINIYKLVSLTGDIINMGFILISPVILTILVNDLVLGLISRASPQINAFQISFTIKPTIGIIVFLLILPLYFTGVANLFSSTSRLF
jgi:flagellar biosynthetic protein FliR